MQWEIDYIEYCIIRQKDISEIIWWNFWIFYSISFTTKINCLKLQRVPWILPQEKEMYNLKTRNAELILSMHSVRLKKCNTCPLFPNLSKCGNIRKDVCVQNSANHFTSPLISLVLISCFNKHNFDETSCQRSFEELK